MLFYIERSPRILKQQTDLTLAQIANDFPITTFNPDLNTATTYIESLSGKLQAGLNELTNKPELYPALSKTLTDTHRLIGSTSDLVASTAQLSTSLNTTIDRLNAPGSKADANGEPVDIQESLRKAAAALGSLDASISGINELLATDVLGNSKISLLAAQLDEQAIRTVDHAYNRTLQLVIIALIGLAVLLVFTRLLFRREKKSAA